MNKQYIIVSVILVSLMLINIINWQEVKAGTATVPLNITVNGSLIITDADNDTTSGKDPTKNVNISVTPDLLQSEVSGSANFRIRSNKPSWRLTTQRTASNAGTTGIVDSDISVTITKTAGSTANVNAGTLVAPFDAKTTLSSVPTIAPAANVVNGTAKTSSAKDPTNANNYFQVNTTYGLAPDFFFSAGTFTTTITYNLVSP